MGLFKFLKEKFSKKDVSVSEQKDSDTYLKGMDKSRKSFVGKMSSLSKRYKKVNEDYFQELEEILIEADVGVNYTFNVILKTLEEAKKHKISDPDEINELLLDILFSDYMKEEKEIETDINFVSGGPTVLLVVGVNGVGKTTTIGKLASRYISKGKSVLLVAGDTFRAGAVEQLKVWANRLNVPIVYGKDNEDPSSVCYRGMEKALFLGVDLVICDTAGRLQTKEHLMNELTKIKRVIAKKISDAPHEIFLVLDATTGQNGVSQARAFKEATDLTGIVITKMDSTSKGGIILAIKNELDIPVRFIGFGEKLDDLRPFDLTKYLYGLCIGEPNE